MNTVNKYTIKVHSHAVQQRASFTSDHALQTNKRLNVRMNMSIEVLDSHALTNESVVLFASHWKCYVDHIVK